MSEEKKTKIRIKGRIAFTFDYEYEESVASRIEDVISEDEDIIEEIFFDAAADDQLSKRPLIKREEVTVENLSIEGRDF